MERLSEYQDRLAGQDTYGVLVVLQALDAGGKDGAIRHVMSGVNPQGVVVHSFQPRREAETGPLATSWHSNKFLDPINDGAVLPTLHLNGYKIANPTVLARIPEHELRALLEGHTYAPAS